MSDRTAVPYTLTVKPVGAVYETTALRIAQTDNFSLCSLQAAPEEISAISAAMKTAFDLALPPPGVTSHTEGLTALGLGAEQWLIEKDGSADDRFDLGLRALLGRRAAITLQTDAWSRFEVTGAQTAPLFARLLAIDLSLASFPQGRCARTGLHHMSCIVSHVVGIKKAYRLYCARSYTQSFVHALSRAASHVAALERYDRPGLL